MGVGRQPVFSAGARQLQVLRPALPAVKYRDDLQAPAPHPIRDHVRRAGHDNFPGASDAPWPTQGRQFGESFHSRKERETRAGGRVRVFARDVVPKVNQMPDRAGRPDDGHARGALRSDFRPQERSQIETSLCATPRPASSSATPA